MGKKVLMKFTRDGIVDGECVFPAGQTHLVDEASVARWERRGAMVVDGGEQEVAKNEKVEVPPSQDKIEEKHVEPKADEAAKTHKRGRPARKQASDDGDSELV